MAPPNHRNAHAASPQRRELYFFTLYRLLEVALLALVAFSPLGELMLEIRQPVVLQVLVMVYLAAALGMVYASFRSQMPPRRQAALGLGLDLLVAGGVLATTSGSQGGIALLLLFNVGAGALILPQRAGLGFATAAALLVLADSLLNRTFDPLNARPLAESVMFSVTYLATAVLCELLSRQVSESQALAEKRGEELANQAEINELVIRRMRTGILVVDGEHRVKVCNEAAWGLLGKPSPDRQQLADIAMDLHRALLLWRQGRGDIPRAMTLAEGAPEVLPRFVSLSLTDNLFLIFLDDSRIYSDRAEELTLATLGRLSASIAHEIRNPLAAINYSVQLLEETAVLPEADRRLLEIIHTQCQRMNGIVQDILGLARRERSQPETVDISQFARRFVDEYRASHPLETDILQAISHRSTLAMADPRHLHQVLTILVQNALTYGRMPGEPAKVTVSVPSAPPGAPPELNVLDRGPGIPAAVAEQIFTPFYTTSEHGTGLGLYIAKQLCEANQCTLSYQPVPGGGSCFRIILPPGMTLMQDDSPTGRLNLA
ncbi:HAMP domain-containing sensor histidine kinase [Arenimonas sp.]|uniref:sensor histidine kinase n=1 Tax=Arenimonas sp. TaxID=1872635 RepID=UPI002E34504E|nr:HAMP domain-containing sensor histidine kinase [Arenimonas sp.]HEX4853457.1 HAMP domain-containing sensor histidine kinase [Arenimonas sp.]